MNNILTSLSYRKTNVACCPAPNKPNIHKNIFFFLSTIVGAAKSSKIYIKEKKRAKERDMYMYSKSQFHFSYSFFAEKHFLLYYVLQGVGAPEASKHKCNLRDDLCDISALLTHTLMFG